MRRRQGKVNRWVLVALAAVSVGLFYAVTRSEHNVRSRTYDIKLASAELADSAFRVVRAHRQQLGIAPDRVNDPNGSGLVGLQYSQTTYGRSDLSDALTAANPNFSAALVEMLVKAGVRRGDTIAVSWDGTYPALNIELLAVARTMGLEPAIVTAQSSATWGANYPGLSWLDIERVLAGAGLWTFRSRFATLGGETDDGRGLSPEGRAMLAAAAESAGVALFTPATLDEGVSRRVAEFGRARVLVSIGHAVADIGDPKARVPTRLLNDRTRRNGYAGVIGALRGRGVPVVHIGKPGQIAVEYHLPVAPVPQQEIGHGRLFHERRYSVPVAAACALVLLALLLLVVQYNIEWHLGARDEIEDKEAV